MKRSTLRASFVIFLVLSCVKFYFGECYPHQRLKREEPPSAGSDVPSSDPPSMPSRPLPMSPPMSPPMGPPPNMVGMGGMGGMSAGSMGRGMGGMSMGGGMGSGAGGMPPMPLPGGGGGQQIDPVKFRQMVDNLRQRWMRIAEQFQGAVQDFRSMSAASRSAMHGGPGGMPQMGGGQMSQMGQMPPMAQMPSMSSNLPISRASPVPPMSQMPQVSMPSPGKTAQES